MIKAITIVCLTFLLAIFTTLWMDSVESRMRSMHERIELLEAQAAAKALPQIQVNRATIYPNERDIWVQTMEK